VRTFEDCISIARRKFESQFKNDIIQLLHVYPLDSKMTDGSDFWKLPKRPPTPLEYDPNNKNHFDFVFHMALLLARLFKVGPQEEILQNYPREKIAKFSLSVEVPKFIPKDNKEISTDEKVTKEEAQKAHTSIDVDLYQTKVNALLALPKLSQAVTLNIEEFEKDDDSNHHVDFITASSNLRAINYEIAPIDRMETKRIAGKIIPAIATTTATIAGLVSMELVKIAIGALPLGDFRNAFINLAVPLYAMSEPMEAPKTKIPNTDVVYTIWDQWEVKTPDITVQDFIKHFENKYGLTVTGVFHGVKSIYVSVLFPHKKRLPQKMKDLIGAVGEDYADLTVTFADKNGEDTEGPSVRLYLK